MSGIEALANLVGTNVEALRFLLGYLVGYPLGAIYNWYIDRGSSATVKHIYFLVCGFSIGYFCFGIDVLHNLLGAVVTYLVLVLLGPSQIAVAIVFVFSMLYLLVGMKLMHSADYDINWTTPHCVLVLRHIGFAFDYYDGTTKSKLHEDKATKDTQLKELPGFLPFLGFTFFFGGFLAGPVFPYQRYAILIDGSIYPGGKRPNPVWPALQSLFIGLGYSLTYSFLEPRYSMNFLLSDTFLNEYSFWDRLVCMMISGKLFLVKYIGVWNIATGVCKMIGIDFVGYDEKTGSTKWGAVANVDSWGWETSPTIRGLVASFNINTNIWVYRYILKRVVHLIGLMPSTALSLFFLAIWHGIMPGYFVNFALELQAADVERQLERIFTGYGEIAPRWQRTIFFVCTWLSMQCVLPYAIVSFALLTWSKFWVVYKSLYFCVHLILLVLAVVLRFLPAIRKSTTVRDGRSQAVPVTPSSAVKRTE
eukprot:gnl/Hemi2/7064_TR2415_c0_g1_i1.p1 gnl/Hemi2/7064_TR2415_c0_g1~~gnl/Hemi2/7064_TR2415_c0_g1_i1.p1  ORF type:complete len:477 (+),score=94.25 gnl/Hemi2/7064_TR2415_c0_g1_i1:85-1515(+)